ncbi:MAG: hypothetical protein ABIP81_00530 [Terriglobales bacterium]
MVPRKSRSSIFTRKLPFYEYSSSPAMARIKVDRLVADIRQDTTASPTIYHCVVQPVDSPEVLFFAQSYTMEEAEEMALQFIRSERKGETA